MADHNSSALLYSSITKLVYSESYLSREPRLPFDFSHRQALNQQANNLGDCAARFRMKNTAQINQAALFAAQKSVNNSQALFGIIATSIKPNFSSAYVFDAVQAVITEVDHL